LAARHGASGASAKEAELKKSSAISCIRAPCAPVNRSLQSWQDFQYLIDAGESF